MKSKDEIKSDLKVIADNHEMTGEAVDMIIDLLTYSLYHEQVNILNTAKEMSLNDAYSMNSKIALCDNVMYSVYRGTCPIVHLNTHFDVNASYDKFDLMYTSNTFYLYSLNPISYTASGTTQSAQLIHAILTKDPIIEKIVTCTYNQYYIDLVDDIYENAYSDISDDVMVTINDVRYEVTRIFSDHCKYDDLIFVLTIPGYGIRLYKKGMFDSGSVVKVKAIVYTRIDDINDADIDNIKIPGMRFIESGEGDSLIEPITYTGEIARQDSDSYLYQANFAGRVNHEIQSNSDVNYLFTEVYIKYVQSSTFKYVKKDEEIYGTVLTEDTLFIRYIPKPGDQLTEDDFSEFRSKYGSYFICDKIDIKPAYEIKVDLNIEIVLTENVSVLEEVMNILSANYNYKLGNNLNKDLLHAEISKLPGVKYIRKFEFVHDSYHELDELSYDEYLTITPNIIYISG